MDKDLALLLIDRANIIEEVVATSLDFDRVISASRLDVEDSEGICRFAKYVIGTRTSPESIRSVLSGVASGARDSAEDFSEPFDTFDKTWGFDDIFTLI